MAQRPVVRFLLLVGFLMLGFGHEHRRAARLQRRAARRTKARRATLAVTATAVAVMSTSSLAGGAAGDGGGPQVSAATAKPAATNGNQVYSLIPEKARAYINPPAHVFPLRGAPEYLDGIGAGRGHEGQDLFAPAGTPELAVADAIVLEAGYEDGGSGNYASIYDPAADRTYNYFHMLESPMVSAGDRVVAGQQLGKLGCSGSCWGDHLHFEERVGRGTWGPVLDPVPLLRRLQQGLTAG